MMKEFRCFKVFLAK